MTYGLTFEAHRCGGAHIKNTSILAESHHNKGLIQSPLMYKDPQTVIIVVEYIDASELFPSSQAFTIPT